MLGCLASLYSQEHFTFRAFSFEIFIYFPFHTQFPLRKKKRKKGGEEVKMSSSVVSTCVRLALMWSRCVTWDTVKKRFWTKPSDDGMEMWYFMKLKKINLLPSYQQMTLVDKNMRKYARKSFLFSCRCWFFSPLSLFVSCADYFFFSVRGFSSHSLRVASCSTASEMSRERQTFPPVVVESYAPSFFAVTADVIIPYLIRFDDIVGVWLLSPLRYHHLWQQPNQA